MDIVKVIYLTITSIIGWNISGKLIDKWNERHCRNKKVNHSAYKIGKNECVSKRYKLKNEAEENMTDKQFNGMLKMILMILDGCKDIEEAKEKVKKLLNSEV